MINPHEHTRHDDMIDYLDIMKHQLENYYNNQPWYTYKKICDTYRYLSDEGKRKLARMKSDNQTPYLFMSTKTDYVFDFTIIFKDLIDITKRMHDEVEFEVEAILDGEGNNLLHHIILSPNILKSSVAEIINSIFANIPIKNITKMLLTMNKAGKTPHDIIMEQKHTFFFGELINKVIVTASDYFETNKYRLQFQSLKQMISVKSLSENNFIHCFFFRKNINEDYFKDTNLIEITPDKNHKTIEQNQVIFRLLKEKDVLGNSPMHYLCKFPNISYIEAVIDTYDTEQLMELFGQIGQDEKNVFDDASLANCEWMYNRLQPKIGSQKFGNLLATATSQTNRDVTFLHRACGELTLGHLDKILKAIDYNPKLLNLHSHYYQNILLTAICCLQLNLALKLVNTKQFLLNDFRNEPLITLIQTLYYDNQPKKSIIINQIRLYGGLDKKPEEFIGIERITQAPQGVHASHTEETIQTSLNNLRQSVLKTLPPVENKDDNHVNMLGSDEAKDPKKQQLADFIHSQFELFLNYCSIQSDNGRSLHNKAFINDIASIALTDENFSRKYIKLALQKTMDGQLQTDEEEKLRIFLNAIQSTIERMTISSTSEKSKNEFKERIALLWYNIHTDDLSLLSKFTIAKNIMNQSSLFGRQLTDELNHIRRQLRVLLFTKLIECQYEYEPHLKPTKNASQKDYLQALMQSNPACYPGTNNFIIERFSDLHEDICVRELKSLDSKDSNNSKLKSNLHIQRHNNKFIRKNLPKIIEKAVEIEPKFFQRILDQMTTPSPDILTQHSIQNYCKIGRVLQNGITPQIMDDIYILDNVNFEYTFDVGFLLGNLKQGFHRAFSHIFFVGSLNDNESEECGNNLESTSFYNQDLQRELKTYFIAIEEVLARLPENTFGPMLTEALQSYYRNALEKGTIKVSQLDAILDKDLIDNLKLAINGMDVISQNWFKQASEEEQIKIAQILNISNIPIPTTSEHKAPLMLSQTSTSTGLNASGSYVHALGDVKNKETTIQKEKGKERMSGTTFSPG